MGLVHVVREVPGRLIRGVVRAVPTRTASLLLVLACTSSLAATLAPVPAVAPGAGLSLDDIWIRDPCIMFHDGTYYITGTTSPDGFLGYSSTDLVSWTLHGFIYERNVSNQWAQQLFWAPEFVEKDGTFYLFFTANSSTRKRATGVAVASHPMGPYVDLGTDPLTPSEWQCLDGHVFRDPAGSGDREYLIFVHEWLDTGTGEMWIQEISPDYTTLVGEKTMLFRGGDASWSNDVVDGPSMIHHEERYFLFWSSFRGGYNAGYAESASLLGPYVQSPRPVITGDGGHTTWFRRDGTGDLLVTYHRPNGGGLERARVQELFFRHGAWFVDLGPEVPASLGLGPLALLLAGIAAVHATRRRRAVA